jgi:CPA2 family monovalent cation:H+ antiporter-2
MLASHALALVGVPLTRVLRRVQKVRESRYALLQGFFHGADDTGADEIEEASRHLRAVSLPAQSPSVGRALSDLPLGGARVTTVVRRSQRIVDPPADLVVVQGDTLVLSGTLEQIGTGEARLLHG